MSRISCWLLSFVIVLGTGTAHAHSRAARQQEPVALRLQISVAGTNATVETADKALGPKGRIVARCESVCEMKLPRGRYQLTLRRDAETSALDSELVNLQRPLQVTTKPASSGLRLLGSTLLITGGIAAGAGLIAIWPNILSSGCEGQPNCDHMIGLARAGYIAAASGGVLCLVGVLLWVTNRTSFVGKRLEHSEPNLSVQFAPSQSGIAGLVTGRF
jgi:hypothetical protein